MEKQLNQYKTEFEEMHERIKKNESPLKVVGDYTHKFSKEGIGPLAIVNYLSVFMKKK